MPFLVKNRNSGCHSSCDVTKNSLIPASSSIKSLIGDNSFFPYDLTSGPGDLDFEFVFAFELEPNPFPAAGFANNRDEEIILLFCCDDVVGVNDNAKLLPPEKRKQVKTNESNCTILFYFVLDLQGIMRQGCIVSPQNCRTIDYLMSLKAE